MEDLAPATDGRNPATLTTWDVKNPVNNGRSYQPQLVSRNSFINSTSGWFLLGEVLKFGKLPFSKILKKKHHQNSHELLNRKKVAKVR